MCKVEKQLFNFQLLRALSVEVRQTYRSHTLHSRGPLSHCEGWKNTIRRQCWCEEPSTTGGVTHNWSGTPNVWIIFRDKRKHPRVQPASSISPPSCSNRSSRLPSWAAGRTSTDCSTTSRLCSEADEAKRLWSRIPPSPPAAAAPVGDWSDPSRHSLHTYLLYQLCQQTRGTTLEKINLCQEIKRKQAAESSPQCEEEPFY